MVILGFTFIFKATQLIYNLKAVRLGGVAGKWRADEGKSRVASEWWSCGKERAAVGPINFPEGLLLRFWPKK